MALNKQGLITDIKQILDTLESDSKKEGSTPEQVKQKYAEMLSDAIDKFVKTGSVNSGIQVQVNTISGTGATISTGSIS